MKKFKKALSVFLVLSLLFALPFQVGAIDVESVKKSASKAFYNSVQVVLESLVGGLASLNKTPESWKTADETDSTGFMKGTEEFLSKPAEDAKFSLGYDSRSLLENAGNVVGEMYIGGSIALKKKFATEIVDDLKVRTAAISDGSGRGISVFVVLDSYGLSLPDTREIRNRLSALAEEKEINSITVCTLHQHSAVDTLGMNGNIWEMAFLNPLRTLFSKKTENGKNERYMENLFETCVESVEAAVSSMTGGKLFYGKADQTAYLRDKRAPFVEDEFFNRFRFVPDDGSKETWIVTSEIHCVGNGAAGTAVTGDYPYYAEKVINKEANANVMFVLGAEQSTSQNWNENTVTNYSEEMTRLEKMAGFGNSLGKHLTEITEETEVAPLLNIKYKQIVLPIDNPILLLAGKAGIFEPLVVKTENGEFGVLTELGYMELGNDLAFAIIPGELAPELAYGGCLGADESWTGTDWSYPSYAETVAEKNGRSLKVIGLANDQVGYIVPDNNFIAMLAPESSSIELVSLGSRTASTITAEFETLVGE